MKGLIMDYPLTLTQLFERSRRLFHKKTMATRVPGAGLERYTYADYADRVCRLASALAGLGLEKGDRVGTFAWNSHRHLEVYFAAPLMGMVLHTVNIRLSAQDIAYIVNHAEDRVLIVDASLWPLLEPIRKDLKTVRHVIVMKDTRDAQPILGRMLNCQNMTMARFADMLQSLASGYIHAPVLDATNLPGAWDFTLSFSTIGQLRNGSSGPAPTEASDPNGAISLPDAISHQLGLKLEMTKRPVKVLVIDHVELKPTDN